MKKSIIKITAVTVFSFISFTALSQQADKKPKIDEANKIAEGPQIVPTAKVLTQNEQPKPVVPGGEFKPMNTNEKVIAPNIKTEPTDKGQPVMPAPKKAGPPPVVTEMNAEPSAGERAKPAPIQLIPQQQQ